jgi:hypothetical protein
MVMFSSLVGRDIVQGVDKGTWQKSVEKKEAKKSLMRVWYNVHVPLYMWPGCRPGSVRAAAMRFVTDEADEMTEQATPAGCSVLTQPGHVLRGCGEQAGDKTRKQ